MSATEGLTVYLVGGAVRDRLLGRTVTERDFVVVGSTAAELRARGFLQVGKNFPVFLHPQTKEEYALARTERKTAPGYHGFAMHADPLVTLEEDLLRRDLTINALAEDAAGNIVDPYGGLADLAARRLRHVSIAFTEDPVRILRVARFATRFADLGFEIAEETRELMRSMIAAGEIDALVPERVWQELARVLNEAQPSRFFRELRECGALARLLPELDRLWGIPQSAQWHPEIDTGEHVMMVVDMAAQLSTNAEVRFAALCHDFGKGTTPPELLPHHHGHEKRGEKLVNRLCDRLKIPNLFRHLARITARDHGLIHRALELPAETLLALLEGADALRQPARFEKVLLACEADARGRAGYADAAYPQAALLRRLRNVVASVNVAAIVHQTPEPEKIPERVQAARIAAIEKALQKYAAQHVNF
ncbi:multifunctional CCA addition/repair protein [Chromatium okenii]|uniref:Multifunctional CCA protein n=1 Tax=Chromatium okenii TaxID=61644 RepID=A0A2S7XUK4_9GAMM|nr:multifunctional CCA addition/repair protein [Chromatium okenii]MBV5308684.1 multifunctional CCA addition/repair protein [Chromatium okenii]PQJ97427.1 multifunctional CCA addition/repair protein [Chromatium okenii]